MVRIPRSSTEYKKLHPNKYNDDGSIEVNETTYATGDTFVHLCIREKGCWGRQFRNAKIESISIEKGKVYVSVKGTSDFRPMAAKCSLDDIV